MARITVANVLSNIPTMEDVQRFLSAFISQATQQINGNLQFNQNIASSPMITVGFTNSSNIVGVTHTLGRVPIGFLVATQTAAASLYAAQGASYLWTSNKIYLQSNVGVTASIFII